MDKASQQDLENLHQSGLQVAESQVLPEQIKEKCSCYLVLLIITIIVCISAYSVFEYGQQVQTSAVTQRRKQQPGLIVTPNGTVCELHRLSKNSKGETIEEVLYPNPEIQRLREEFNAHRISILRKNWNFESLGLSKFTIKLDDSLAEEERVTEAEEYERLATIHDLQHFPLEIPMCIVVPSYNNRANFRLEYNLNSIFLQNYSNYFAVIINDASTDGSHDLFSRYFDFYRIDPAKFVYVHNKQRRTALENIYSAVWEHCSSDSVVVNLDGDDELIGRNVLKVFNANYQKYKMGVIYSNYYRYHSDGRIEPGWTTDYSQNVKTRLAFRSSSQSFSHLKTHRADLFRRIPIEALQDDSGRFFTITSDLAIYFPLMELACGKVMKIRGHHYLYNFNTGLNDYSVDHRLQLEVERQVRGGKQLPCPS